MLISTCRDSPCGIKRVTDFVSSCPPSSRNQKLRSFQLRLFHKSTGTVLSFCSGVSAVGVSADWMVITVLIMTGETCVRHQGHKTLAYLHNPDSHTSMSEMSHLFQEIGRNEQVSNWGPRGQYCLGYPRNRRHLVFVTIQEWTSLLLHRCGWIGIPSNRAQVAAKPQVEWAYRPR